MSTYKQFLKTTKFPSEEEFNETIEKLPPFDNLDPNSFQFDPEYDNLEEWLFVHGFLYSLNIYNDFDYLDVDLKEVSISNLDLEQLNELNERLISAGWTLTNYEEEKENFEELNSNRKKAIWWALHQNEISLEDLEKLIQK